MLKGIGAGLILITSFLYGVQLKQKLYDHVKHLIRCKEMLLMLSGEMTYTRTPLGEAFLHIAAQGKEPFGAFLEEVAGKMDGEHEKPLLQIWKESLENHKKEICFSKEEFSILETVGENFGYLDIEMQLNHIKLCVQQVDNQIVQAQKELESKQKMYQYLSVMCGLFFILILI